MHFAPVVSYYDTIFYEHLMSLVYGISQGALEIYFVHEILIYTHILVDQLAVCGDMFDMSFALPFNDYLPPTVPIKFFIRVSKIIHIEPLTINIIFNKI